MTVKQKKRAKYSRPCDACSLRKIRCDGNRPCIRCSNNAIACTDVRVRKKTGPKKMQPPPVFGATSSDDRGQRSRSSQDGRPQADGAPLPAQSNSDRSPSAEPAASSQFIPMEKLLPFLQVYQTWYYGVWPVLSVAHLVSRIVYDPAGGLNPESADAYGLACAVAAAIARQVTFMSSNSHMNLPNDILAQKLAAEALRVRKLFDERLQVTQDSLLAAFFLYVYYVNIRGGVSASILYLREAISIAQILGYHDVNNYNTWTATRTHRCRKIYYMLLVTERFMCIEDKLPVVLDATIPFPSLEDEEYLGLLSGFTELVKIFAIPDKRFFDKFIEVLTSSDVTSVARTFDIRSQSMLRRWIEGVQTQLERIEISGSIPDSSKLNLLLSQHWMLSLAWHISRNNGLLLKVDNPHDILSPLFPVRVAHNFLAQSENLPMIAYESNGPGASVKLLELGSALADAILEALVYRFDTNHAYDALNRIFRFINVLKNDVTMSQSEYNRLFQLLCNRSMTLTNGAFITEVSEDDDLSKGDLDRRLSEQTSFDLAGFDDAPSPFTQMTLAFTIDARAPPDGPLGHFDTDVFSM